MRGFRGSRAAQSLSSRSGRDGFRPLDNPNGHANSSQNVQSQRTPLPNWLKTPETQERERAEEKRIAQASHSQPKIQAPLHGVAKHYTPVVVQKAKDLSAIDKTKPAAKQVVKSKKKPVAEKKVSRIKTASAPKRKAA